ncbi:MAG: hypothetical protein WD942_09015 [Dehalococcoidia bacterium]
MADRNAKLTQGKKKLILIANLAALLVLIGGGVTAMLVLGADDEAGETSAVATPTPTEGNYVDLKVKFVIDCRDRNNRPKFLEAEIAKVPRDDSMEEVITRDMPIIPSYFVLLLRS